MKVEIFNSNSLNFVELNITGDNVNYNKCAAESKYMNANVFNLFAACFEKSNKLYEYYGPSKYNARNYIPLRNNLEKNLTKLEEIDSQVVFLNYVNQIFLGKNFILELEKQDKNWRKNWNNYVKRLMDISKGIIQIINKCIDEGRILWVIGY